MQYIKSHILPESVRPAASVEERYRFSNDTVGGQELSPRHNATQQQTTGLSHVKGNNSNSGEHGQFQNTLKDQLSEAMRGNEHL